MGLHGFSPLSLLLILFIVLIIFGGKRLQQIGSELGSAIRNFRKGLEEENKTDETKSVTEEKKAEKD